jgi:hypothetical protein
MRPKPRPQPPRAGGAHEVGQRREAGRCRCALRAARCTQAPWSGPAIPVYFRLASCFMRRIFICSTCDLPPRNGGHTPYVRSGLDTPASWHGASSERPSKPGA